MGIEYSKERIADIIKQTVGKKVTQLSFVEEESYWVMEFSDGSEMSFKFMTEIYWENKERLQNKRNVK